jgi:hypothetical protein
MKRIYPVKTTEQFYKASSVMLASLLTVSAHIPAKDMGLLVGRLRHFADCIFSVAETSVREDVRSTARKAKKRGRK